MLPRPTPHVRRALLTTWVDAVHVSLVLRVSKMTVYRLIKSGELPATRVGRSLRIKESDLDDYILSHPAVDLLAGDDDL